MNEARDIKSSVWRRDLDGGMGKFRILWNESHNDPHDDNQGSDVVGEEILRGAERTKV